MLKNNILAWCFIYMYIYYLFILNMYIGTKYLIIDSTTSFLHLERTPFPLVYTQPLFHFL